MLASELLADLSAQGVKLSVFQGKIEFDAPAGVMTTARLDHLKRLKGEMVGLILQTHHEECQTHVPPFILDDASDPKRFGWIRSTCRRCGRFIGYRQVTCDERQL